jgi:hypothetical protein
VNKTDIAWIECRGRLFQLTNRVLSCKAPGGPSQSRAPHSPLKVPCRPSRNPCHFPRDLRRLLPPQVPAGASAAAKQLLPSRKQIIMELLV